MTYKAYLFANGLIEVAEKRHDKAITFATGSDKQALLDWIEVWAVHSWDKPSKMLMPGVAEADTLRQKAKAMRDTMVWRSRKLPDGITIRAAILGEEFGSLVADGAEDDLIMKVMELRYG